MPALQAVGVRLDRLCHVVGLGGLNGDRANVCPVCDEDCTECHGREFSARLDRLLEKVATQSSVIHSYYYDSPLNVLSVRFKDRMDVIYSYIGVPFSVAVKFRMALSKGRYFAENIRGKYEFKVVGAHANSSTTS